MKLSKPDQMLLRSIIEDLARLSMYAADPHLDCRDEMASIIEGVNDQVDELLDDDDQADVPTAVAGDAAAEKGGGQ
jgi:hypothetical protein